MIHIVQKVESLRALLLEYRIRNENIGFVPTMGALHQGHISLVKESVIHNSCTVLSIFVNPTQFNVQSDLDKYRRDLPGDIAILQDSGVSIVFAPNVDDVYPEGMNQKSPIDLDGLDRIMEGEHRPGHFEGVVQVVKRLLDIVEPDALYMGQKDFQQFTIIKHVIKKLELTTNLIVCPIIREDNGLAMSSRNERLSSDGRKIAGKIYEVLQYFTVNYEKLSIEQLYAYAKEILNQPPLQLEYVSIVNGDTLQEINGQDRPDYVVVCIAVWIEGVRLIDNQILAQ